MARHPTRAATLSSGSNSLSGSSNASKDDLSGMAGTGNSKGTGAENEMVRGHDVEN